MEAMDRRVQVEEVVVEQPPAVAIIPTADAEQNVVHGTKDESVYFDKSKGKNIIDEVTDDNPDLEKFKDNILSGLNASMSTSTSVPQQENLTTDLAENMEEEVIELEFQSAAEKVHTHTPYCPHCNRRITKVTLRRRKPKDTSSSDSDSNPQREDERSCLLGCLSCLRLFIPSGDCLNPFPLFGWGTSVTSEPSKPPQPYHQVPQPGASGVPGAVTIDLPDGTVIRQAEVSTSLEILKCIVYGGLMELIASLSVVSSAAASDASTLSILCISLATMISTLLIFGQDLLKLNNDIPQENSDRYQELLGRRGNFPFHSSLAILSFIIFGLIPPVVYAFAFHESNNKDYKILAVAVASFICVVILATAKAHIKPGQCLKDYVKTVIYYVTMAVSVSGVAYAAGHLLEVLMERLGWFEPAPKTAGYFVPNMVSDTQAWSSY